VGELQVTQEVLEMLVAQEIQELVFQLIVAQKIRVLLAIRVTQQAGHAALQKIQAKLLAGSTPAAEALPGVLMQTTA
jgi:hypothetical protein